jgi:hypothetical protein
VRHTAAGAVTAAPAGHARGASTMTDNGNDRRRDVEGRINTLGAGNDGVSGRRSHGADATEGDDADSEAGVTPDADGDDRGGDEETERETEVTPEASTDDYESEEEDRSSLDVELDRFVRAFATRRAESLDEYVVGSVKGYLAGLLGGDVESPGTLKRRVEVEADDVFGGLLDAVAGEEQDRGDVVVAAVAEAYDVPEDDELTVAGLRDHEAMLNGVVANSSNSLGDVSEVVQAAVETRLIEEDAE